MLSYASVQVWIKSIYHISDLLGCHSPASPVALRGVRLAPSVGCRLATVALPHHLVFSMKRSGPHNIISLEGKIK